MPISPGLIKLLAGIAFVAGLMGVSWFYGYSGQHDILVSERAKNKQAADSQAILVDKLNKELEANKNESAKQTADAVQSINDYYKLHPVVRVRYKSGSCSAVSEADSNPQSIDGTTAIGYVSPYSPKSTEQVANRLDQLQKLLVKDRVQVK